MLWTDMIPWYLLDIPERHSVVVHTGFADPAPVAQTFFMDDHLCK